MSTISRVFNKTGLVWRLWLRTADGVLDPVWFCGPALPNSLVDLLDPGNREAEEEKAEENEAELDFDYYSESNVE